MPKSKKGYRGTILEEEINITNDFYRENNIGLIQKIPTPITPIRMNKGNITLAYFSAKSTVDYIGLSHNKALCFDAKECKKTTFPLKNIHEHQVKFMNEWEQNGGVAFLIIKFIPLNQYYILSCEEMNKFIAREESGGRKSFTSKELEGSFFIKDEAKNIVPYMEHIIH